MLQTQSAEQAGKGWVSGLFVRRWGLLSVLRVIYVYSLGGSFGDAEFGDLLALWELLWKNWEIKDGREECTV